MNATKTTMLRSKEMTATPITTAAIVSNGEILAVFSTDIHSGRIEAAYDGNAAEGVLYNPFNARLTRAKSVLESRAARECSGTATLVASDTVYPRFILK